MHSYDICAIVQLIRKRTICSISYLENYRRSYPYPLDSRHRPMRARVDIAYDIRHLQNRYTETPYIVDICITKLQAYNNAVNCTTLY